MISVNREALIRAMGRCATISPAKSPNPSLTHALLELAGKTLRYRATDLVRSVAGTIEATGEAAWFCIKPREFGDVLATLQGERVKIKHGAGFVQVTGDGKRTFKIRVFPPEEFPADAFDASESFELPDTFGELTASVVHAAAVDDDREHLKAVHLSHKNGKLTAFALNGRAAAQSETETDCAINCAISVSTLKLLGDLKPATLSVSGSSQRFETADGDSLTVISPGSNLPPLAIDPFSVQGEEHRVSVSTAPLIDAVAAVQLADHDQSRDVILTFGKTLVVEAHGGGYARDEIDVECPAEARIGLAARALIDALRAAGETVELCYAIDGLQPFILRSGSWRSCLMPIMPQHLEGKAKL